MNHYDVKYMQVFGFIKGGCKMIAPSGMRYSVKIDPHYREASASGYVDDDYISNLATGRVVRPCRDTVDASFLKCDSNPEFVYSDHQEKCMDYADRFISPVIRASSLQPDNYAEINTKSSPGYYFKKLGCKTKGDALLHPDFYDRVRSIDDLPLVDVNPKVEILEIEDIIDRAKIRTTFNCAMDFIVKQKILFDGQNEAMKRNHSTSWFKYGFVKQYGGFGRLGKQLAVFTMITEHDITGWDRDALMDRIYNLRRKNLVDYHLFCVLFEWVLYFTLNSYCIGPDGYVYIIRRGNRSGSNNTTSDNMLFHGYIGVDIVVSLFIHRFGRFPSYSEFSEVCEERVYLAIYSDDVIMSIDNEYFRISVEEFECLKVKVYTSWGMKIKVSSNLTTLCTGGIIDRRHQFLGSHFVYSVEYDTYVPYPRIHMLASSLKYYQGKLDVDSLFMKVVCLLVLSAPEEPLFLAFEGFLVFLLQKYGAQSLDFLSEYWRDMLLNNRGRQIWMNISTGREQWGGQGKGVFNFIEHLCSYLENGTYSGTETASSTEADCQEASCSPGLAGHSEGESQ